MYVTFCKAQKKKIDRKIYQKSAKWQIRCFVYENEKGQKIVCCSVRTKKNLLDFAISQFEIRIILVMFKIIFVLYPGCKTGAGK